jgi:hypothetical protein
MVASVAMPKRRWSKRRVVISGFVVIQRFFRCEGAGGAKWSTSASACAILTMRTSMAALGKAVRSAVSSGRHEMTKGMRKTRSIGPDIEWWWKVNEVQIPGTKNALYRAFLDSLGRAAIWNGEIEECYFQKALHRLRPNLELVTSQYIAILMYFLAHNSGLTDHTTSATIAHLTGIKLKNIDIPLPPLNLQQKYVGIEEEYKSVEPKNMRVSKEIQYLFDSLTHLAFRGELTDRAAKEIFQQAAAS